MVLATIHPTNNNDHPMTKRDYMLIASVFNDRALGGNTIGRDPNALPEIFREGERRTLARMMAHAMARAYPTFDHEKFIHACHVYERGV
jgi:hypothetical protein